MTWNLFDIVKSIAVVVVLIFLWTKGSAIIDGFNKPQPKPPEIIRIDENAIKLSAITASNAMAEKMRKQWAAEKNELLAKYEEDRKKTGEILDELGRIKGELKQTRDLINGKSDHTYTSETKPENTQVFKKIYAKAADGERFPIAWSIYYPFKPEGEQWKTGTYPLEFYTDILESENPDGTFNRSVKLYAMNNQMKETKGKEFKLYLDKNAIQWQKYERKEKSFLWWNPRLALGGAATSQNVSAQLNLSLSSYGKTAGDMDWRFFTFGAGGAKDNNNWKTIFSFEPFSWNLGKPLPLVDNIFVGPVLTIDSKTEYGYGLQISVPF